MRQPYKRPPPAAPKRRSAEERRADLQQQKEQRAAKKEAARYADLRYDYSWLAENLRPQMQEIALDIRGMLKRTAREVIEIGLQLITAKKMIGHGKYLEWIDGEFGMSERSARNFVNAAERYGDKSAIIADLDVTTLYLLAAPSTPPEARAQIEDRMRQGEDPSYSEVKRVIAEVKEVSVKAHTRAAPFRVGIENAPPVAMPSVLGVAAGGGPDEAENEAGAPSAAMLGMNMRKKQGAQVASAPTRVRVEIDVDLRDTLVEALRHGSAAGYLDDRQRARLIEQLGG